MILNEERTYDFELKLREPSGDHCRLQDASPPPSDESKYLGACPFES